MPLTLAVRRARPEDVEPIRRVAGIAWRQAYKDVFTPAQIDDFLAKNYSDEELTAAFTEHEALWFVAEDLEGAGVVGFAHFRQTSEGAQLARLYVHPLAWRNGAGSLLLKAVERELQFRGIARYHLFVQGQNAVGKAFYAKHGFTHVPAMDRKGDWYLQRRFD